MNDDWPHAPVHRFGEVGAYFITGSTHQRRHHYDDPDSLDQLQLLLFRLAAGHLCSLQAWSLFTNHYHLVLSSKVAKNIHQLVSRFHSEASRLANQRDGIRGRQVWYQYRDTLLTYEASWLARLRYTHENAVHHGLVATATDYRWCSASWFERTAGPGFFSTVRRMKIDRLNVIEYEI
jgi:putative transposase